MYLFHAINANLQLIDINKKTNSITNSLSFDISCLRLPLHVSLKIAYEIDDNKVDDVINDINKIYNLLKPFVIEIDKIECINNICWIKIKPNNMLDNIHNQIVNMLKEKYNIIPHTYDLDFIYHISLFIDDNSNKVIEAYNKIKDIELPKTLLANRFITGYSINGKLGTYEVKNEIIKTGYKRKVKSQSMTGEDIDMFNDKKLENETKKSICDIHQDGA